MLRVFSNRVVNISKIYHGHGIIVSFNVQTFLNNANMYSSNCKYFSTNPVHFAFMRTDEDEGFLKKILKKVPFLDVSKHRIKVSSYILYEQVADKINYNDFFHKYSLPDTFCSWFVITELHIWMVLVRAMAEGEDGRYTRNCIVQAMWFDIETRVKKLGAANPAGVRAQVYEISQQFQAALISYDEGLQSNDKVLASALWRRFFQQQCDNPEHLESLVHYVRKQIKMLDHLTTDEYLVKRQISWNPLKSK